MTKALTVLILLTSCAHSYSYHPEIDGDGAKQGRKGGVVYTIPATGSQELTLRIRSLGIHRVNNREVLGIRMSFTHSNSANAASVYLKPEEQILHPGPSTEIDVRPSFVHTEAKKGNVVNLGQNTTEVVELLYRLPDDLRGAKDLQEYSLQWSVHYQKNQTETKTVRFDREDAIPQKGVEYRAWDPNYPYDLVPVDMPGWYIIEDPYWLWSVDPWSPW